MVHKLVLVPFVLAAITGAPAFGRGLLESSAEVTVATEEVPEGLCGGDWASIRAAYEAGRHRVFAADGGHRADNPGQHWTTLFDGRGFTTTPDAGGWSWGLELVRYGWGAEQHEVALPRSVSAEGGRVGYAWDERLGEWYVNDARGLEHGYTVAARPEGATGPLVIELSIRGGLAPEISADGRDVRFLDERGDAVLTYAGLVVLDADGRAVAAGWRPLAGSLQLRIEDQDARYPLTIDPIANQQGYLKASNTEELDRFGSAVAVSGDTVVVGASGEDSNATGVNGDQTNNLANASGAAYVFVRSGLTWSQQAYLKASNTEEFDGFGGEVSIFGDTIVVSASGEDSNAGAAYVFVRSGTTWNQEAYLKASNTEGGDNFGGSVSLFGDTVVVGAPREDSTATGVNGNQGNGGSAGWQSGAAYVFVRSGTTWSQEAYLKASNTGRDDFFGGVSISGDTIVVGATGEDSNATGVNGDESNDLAFDSGAAYVFVRNGSIWSQEAYLKASNTEASDGFGGPSSISGDRIVVGASGEDSNATGVNGDEIDNLAPASGAAYVFVRNGSTWSQEAYLKASNTEAGDLFGSPSSISGDTIVVGAMREDSNATGVNGDEGNNLTSNSGAAYVFVRNGPTWSQAAYLKASNTGIDDSFGDSVSFSGDTLVVGASGENSSATGVNGNQANNSEDRSGAAYVLDLFYASVVYCTAGTSAAGCQASIGSAGTASAAASSGFSLHANGVESQKDGLFFFGTNGRQANPWGNSTSFQCVVPPVVRTGLLSGSGSIVNCDGSFELDLNAFWCPSCPKPSKNPGAGALVQAQFWYRNPQSPVFVTTALSDAIEFQVAP